MSRLGAGQSREDVLRRVRELIAAESGLDAFEVKPDDGLDADLGIAGDDVDVLFSAVQDEFGTDFSQLGEYLLYYFYPEVSATSSFGSLAYGLWLVPCALLYAACMGLASRLSLPLKGWVVGGVLVCLSAAVWAILRWRHNATHEPRLLTFTVNDVVDAVMAERWTAPEDIWEQIDRLARKKASS